MGYQITTKNGYDLFEMSSMLQKAIRRSDIPHAAYAANELGVKYRKYLWKRLLTISAEDCFGIMTKEIIALKEADEYVNKSAKNGTNDLFIAKAVILMCMARKNRDADYVACNFMWGDRTLRGKMNGKTKLDMIQDEQQALEPYQMSLFDYGNWEGMFEHDRKTGKMTRQVEARLPEFQRGKELDPTHGGERMSVAMA